jgi:hypothetical protein
MSTEANTDTSTPSQPAHIVGSVEVRQGDGTMQTIRPGPVEVQTTDTDATLSWTEEDTHGAVAMPLTDFKRHLAKGTIRMEVAATP